MKKFILFLIFLIVINTVSAATIHGTIYDLSLDKVTNVIVKINTIPEQTYVAKDGTYTFNVPIGEYTITAKYSNSYIYSATEEISINDDGDYVIDLLLFPSFEEEEELIEDIEFDIEDEYFEKGYGLDILVYFIILITFGFIIYLFKKKIKGKKEKITEEKKEEGKKELKSEDYYDKVYEIIKKEKRTTQKDIRKEIPLSEARISLIITQLEHEGKIRKIKKGRGNVIILKQ